MTETETEALTRFMRRLAVAVDELARSLDGAPGRAAASLEAIRPPLGKRQRQIVGMARINSEDGMRAAEIAAAMNGPDAPNPYLILDSLERRGVLERTPNASPRRYRLAPPYRAARPRPAHQVVRDLETGVGG
jgi:hypothetical protein